jgi:APA family basic amino acid/polyamine antiporter
MVEYLAGKDISVWAAMAVGLGGIIGAGIFVLSGTAISLAGPYSLLAFVVVGILALVVAREFGVLTSIMPKAEGASYSYVYKAFGSELGFITGVVQYFGYSTTISAIALGFGSYLFGLIGTQFGISAIGYAIALILLLAVVNLLGVKGATRTESALVAIKIAVLLLFIGFALYFVFGLSHISLSNFAPTAAQSTPSAFFAACLAIFFAYTGFQAITTLTTRIKGKAQGASKALTLAVVISMVLYILIALSLIFLAPARNYTVNADPLNFALGSSSAPSWIVIAVGIGALVATASATLSIMLGSSRVLHQMSKDRLLPSLFRHYNKRRDVSISGIVFSSVIGITMLFSGNIYIIAAISNIGTLFSYLMASAAVLHFGRKGAVSRPLYPYMSIAAMVFILILIMSLPSIALQIAIAAIISLLIIYYLLREIEGKKIIRIKLFR